MDQTEEKQFQSQITELAESQYSLSIHTMLLKLSVLEDANKTLNKVIAAKDVEIEALGRENCDLRKLLNAVVKVNN
jgi:hypothetical protein